MRLAHRLPRLRRGLSFLAFFALLGFVTVGLSQCKAVQDNLTGVSASLAKAGPGGCISKCARDYADSNRVEVELHTANVQGCDGDPVCQALEEARHEAAVDRISAGRQECFNNCRYQSGGTGGE